MHTIDLKNTGLRTDLVMDEINSKKEKKIEATSVIKKENVTLEEIKIEKSQEEIVNKKEGIYRTVSFKDITDKNNFKEVEKVLIEALKKNIRRCEFKRTK